MTDERPGGSRREVVALGFLFGAMYFAQGIGEPTEGLIAQPVRSLLKSWGESASAIAAFSAILALPWAFKPLYGLLTDFVPLAGYRRKSYLVLASFAATAGLAVAATYAATAQRHSALLGILLVPTIGVAFCDVVVDALMVERGQRYGMTGRFQSIQWAAMYSATILTGTLGGYLSGHGLQALGFLVASAAALVTLVLTLAFVREAPQAVARPPVRDAGRTLLAAFRVPAILAVGGFLFLWSFNPFTNDILYLHMTRTLGFDEQFYGHTVSLLAAASVAASVAYGFYCRRVAFRWLVHASIVLGILATVAYWAVTGRASAVVVTLAVGFTYMTATLIQLDLAAQACPAAASATAFAVLMALTNVSMSASTALGGWLYERWSAAFDPARAFQLLVGLGALLTAGCWLFVPVLARTSRAWDRPQAAEAAAPEPETQGPPG